MTTSTTNRKPVTVKTLKRLLAESHREQFSGKDYQAVTFTMWHEYDLTEDQLNELQSSPEPGCGCGFCEKAEWVD